MNKEQVIARLKKRQFKGERQEDFAQRIGEHQPNISSILKGKLDPTPNVLKFLGLKKITSVEYVKAGR